MHILPENSRNMPISLTMFKSGKSSLVKIREGLIVQAIGEEHLTILDYWA